MLRMTVLRLAVVSMLGVTTIAPPATAAEEVISLGSRRELFVDHFLIDRLDGAALALARPADAGLVMKFDKPWESRFSAYVTVLKDGDRYRMYYRGVPESGPDGNEAEVTCTAESADGIHWTKPNVGLFEVHGTRENNVVLADASPFTHNFCPMIDTRPGVPESQRYKAVAGHRDVGLWAFVSADGLQWRKLREEPILKDEKYLLDSQNLAFWSQSENCYVCYFRTWNDVRWVSRSTSEDFLNWTPGVVMEARHAGAAAPPEQLYTNQTGAYFRAPHIYIATAARFMPDRQVISEEEAKAINVDPGYFKDVSDAVLLTSRGGNVYDRTFMEGFLRPGIGPKNWVSRTNYPALNVVQTGPDEMSLYVQNDYAQTTACLRRYTLRLDGFASVRTPFDGGEMLTKPLTFEGKRLSLNFATSAAGGIRVEIQDAQGKPIPGYTLDDADEVIGNEIDRSVRWRGKEDVSPLAGQPIRLRFVMKDADLYALKFE
ncbi:MAG: hypothetical protein GX621_11160 [Pirellulaceae bacterium]|nr:hypothetical protein [Pirellulaceae bacterium]